MGEPKTAADLQDLLVLYPVVTILLSIIFLHERISLRGTVGIAFASSRASCCRHASTNDGSGMVM
ncbi:MAG TPA: hypothetical protein VF311_01975 [Terriglobales bacterium]